MNRYGVHTKSIKENINYIHNLRHIDTLYTYIFDSIIQSNEFPAK